MRILTTTALCLALAAPAHANAYNFWDPAFWRANGAITKPADKPAPRLEATASNIRSLPVTIGTERPGYIKLNLRMVRNTGASVTYYHNGKAFGTATVQKGGKAPRNVDQLRSPTIALKPGDKLAVKITTPEVDPISWAVECVYTDKSATKASATDRQRAATHKARKAGERKAQERREAKAKDRRGNRNSKGSK